MQKVRWGVLGVAGIATKKMIPAMQRGTWSEVMAIASRDLRKAQQAAASHGISRAYGSYDELLADRDVEAIYIPLPNHLHAYWTVRAAEAGKHVLCEKPIALNLDEAERLPAVRDRTGVTIQEAFMYTIQGDVFSRAVREGLTPAVPLEDSVRNMATIDALFRSADSGRWETGRSYGS